MINLNWTQFCDKYSPIKNTIEVDTPCDGFLFLDKDQLRDVPLERIWTLIGDQVNDDMFITNGAKIINSHGWLVTRESWIDTAITPGSDINTDVIEVRLEESDCKKNDDENTL